MQNKIFNLNIRIEPHVKKKARKLARAKGVSLTDLIVGYIVSDYALRSIFEGEQFEETEEEQNES